MTVPQITTRAVKGSALTHAEMDSNLNNLQAPNLTIRAGTTTGSFSTFYDLTISNTSGIGSSIAGNVLTITNLLPSVAFTFSNTATLTLSNVSGNISGTVAGTTFSAASGSATISPGSTLSIANSATIGGYITGTTLTLDNFGFSMIAGGTTTTGARGFTISNTATVGASLSSNTLSISAITTGTAGTYQGAITTDVYGRVTAGSNQYTANVDANGQYISNAYLNNYREQVANVGPFTGTVTINANTAPVQTGAVTGSITLNTNNFTNLLPGKSVTILLYATGNYTLTSNLKFVQGTKTISTTAGNIDALTVFYDGTSYIAGLAKYW